MYISYERHHSLYRQLIVPDMGRYCREDIEVAGTILHHLKSHLSCHNVGRYSIDVAPALLYCVGTYALCATLLGDMF